MLARLEIQQARQTQAGSDKRTLMGRKQREQNHQHTEPSVDEAAVESRIGGSQGDAGADSDEGARAGDGPICGAAAAVGGSAAVDGVARDEP